MGIETKNFYLNTPTDWYEYMRLPVDISLQKIIDKYQLMDKFKNGFIMCEIRHGMYGFTQEGIISNKQITESLENNRHWPCEITPGLWKHDAIPVIFWLTVNNFGVKYVGK